MTLKDLEKELDKIWEKKSSQIGNRIMDLFNKINEEYPEILHLSKEQYRKINAYYEVKMMEHTKRQDLIIAIMTGIIVVLTALNIYFSFK